MPTRIAKWLGLHRPRTSLQTILTYPFVFLIMATVVLTGTFLFYQSGKAIDLMAEQLMDKITDQIQDHIMIFLDRAHLVNEINANAIEAEQIDPKKITMMEVHFWNQVRSFEYISYSYLGSAEGGFWGARRLADGKLQVIATKTLTGGEISYFNTDDRGRPTKVSSTLPSYDHKTRPWYKAAIQKGKPTWSPVFVDAGGEGLTITAVKPLYDVAGKTKGVLGSSFIFSHINQFLRSLKIGKSGQTFIMERSGMLVATSTSDPTSTANKERITARESENPQIRHASRLISERFGDLSGIDREQRLSIDIKGERYFIYLTPFSDGRGIDWLISVIVPENDFMSSIKESHRNTILLSLIALILTIMAGFMISRRITQPILKLNSAARSLAAGEWSEIIEIDRQDEIGELAKSFNLMAHQLRDAIENLEQKVADRTEEILEINRKRLASEIKYRELYENLRDGSIMFDREGNITESNTAFQNLTGYSTEEIQSLKFTDITPVRWQAVEKEILTEQVLKRGYSDPYEKEYIRKDGTIFSVELSTYLVRDENNNPSAFWAFVRDITDRKRAEEALTKSEERFRKAFYTTPDSVNINRLEDGMYISINPGFTKSTGYTEDDIIGKTSIECDIWVNIEDRQRLVAGLKKDGEVSNLEAAFRMKSGEIRYGLMSVSLIDLNGVPHLLNITRDITDRKRGEEALRTSEERFRALSENAPDIIYTMNLEGAITYANPSWRRLLGHEEEDVQGRYFTEFAREEDKGTYRKLFKSIRDDGKTINNHIGIMLTKEGAERVFNMNFAFNRNSEDRIIGVVGTLKDITEFRDMEKKLIHAQKMEGIGTMAGGIAHDFNNLLMGIQGYASLALMDLDPSDPNYERLKKIEEHVQSGADLSKQLLGFARGGRYEIKPTDMNDIINKTSSMFGRTKKEITIHRKFEKDLWNVEVDRGQMEQVFMNLYVNAWQAMPGGGEIYLETENVLLNDVQTFPYTVESGSYVKITVTDTGMGMDEKTREQIFDPFFTTKGIGRGTGLGLAMVYGIIKGHKGMIDVYSKSGYGTTFILYLPVSEKEVVKEEPASGTIAKGAGTILLVDDEKMIMEVCKDLLESIGYRVYVTGSGQEAIAVFMEKGNDIDMVILDMIMPGLSGGETFDRLRRINPGIKVLLSSGYSITGEAQQILDRGCNGFLQKPFQLEKLSQKVKEILD